MGKTLSLLQVEIFMNKIEITIQLNSGIKTALIDIDVDDSIKCFIGTQRECKDGTFHQF